MNKTQKQQLITETIQEWADKNNNGEVTEYITAQLTPQIEKIIAKRQRQINFTKIVKNKETGTLTQIDDVPNADGDKYTVICLTHDSQCCNPTNKNEALILRNNPTNFCEGCTGVSDIPATPDKEIYRRQEIYGWVGWYAR